MAVISGYDNDPYFIIDKIRYIFPLDAPIR